VGGGGGGGGGGGLSNLTLQCFILLCGQCKKIFRSSSFQLFIHSSSSTLMMKLLLTCKRIKKDNRNVMRDLWGKGKGSRKSIWNFHSCPFLLFIHTDNNNNMSMANVAWWRIPKLLLPHMHDHFWGGWRWGEGQVLQAFWEFLCNYLRHYRRCFWAQSMH